MPVASVVVAPKYTKAHAAHPPVPGKLSLDEVSGAMFKAAPEGVGFTGIVHLPSKVVYLHPLVATRAGNVEMEMRLFEHVPSAGALDGLYDTKPILHPNLTPQLRAQAGLKSGHHTLCETLKFSLDDCVGFALTKQAGANQMTTGSRTLNADKFVKDPPGAEKLPPKLKAIYGKPVISDGELNRAWATRIAVTIELAFTHYVKNPSGHCEAPF